ncbi:YegS/Rv2252/BmrU family lipid kinase [Clostridia bacterium]|nr:YegS/Rv2252/BmrU family lipid kinase [Clostridia bacterium]
MKRVLLIYNPMAGTQEFNVLLDEAISVFQREGIQLDIYRSREQMDFYNYLEQSACTLYQAVIVAGGDGSVSLALNAMMKKDIRIPLGIIPAGTSNDFAYYLGISPNLHEAIRQLSKMNTRWIDVGKVNDIYFINVCGGGVLPNVAHKVDREAKNIWGKAAYYVNGFMEMGKNKTFRIKLRADEEEFEMDVFLYLVMNGPSAGGFTKMGVKASADDGKLDFIAIKSLNLIDVPMLFSKILRGEHFNDNHVQYLKGENFEIDFLSGDKETEATSVDGEMGPDYPLSIQVCKHHLEVIF